MTAEELNDIARNHFNMGDYTFYETAASEALGAAQEAGKIHVSEAFVRAVGAVHELSLRFINRGRIDIKSKGIMTTYFLEKR